MSETEWLRPIDPLQDSDAPDALAEELARRHAPYLREAQRIALEHEVPDEAALAEGVRAETRRYLESHPWHAVASLRATVEEIEASTLASLARIAAAARASAPAPAVARPVRRLALGPAATVVGTLPLRKRRTPSGVTLEWKIGRAHV